MRIVAIVAAVTATGCAPAPPPEAPIASADPSTPAKGEDQCGAKTIANLVGRPVTEAPKSAAGHTRVVAEGDAVTMDYSPQRLNIYYDRSTGRITRIECG